MSEPFNGCVFSQHGCSIGLSAQGSDNRHRLRLQPIYIHTRLQSVMSLKYVLQSQFGLGEHGLPG